MEGQSQAIYIAPLYGEREGMASGLAGPSHSYLRDETRVEKMLIQSYSASWIGGVPFFQNNLVSVK